jgi:hypothetical protein
MFLPKAEKTNEPKFIVFVLTNFNLTLTCIFSLPAAAQPRSRRGRASGIWDNSHVNLKAIISAKILCPFPTFGPALWLQKPAINGADANPISLAPLDANQTPWLKF